MAFTVHELSAGADPFGNTEVNGALLILQVRIWPLYA